MSQKDYLWERRIMWVGLLSIPFVSWSGLYVTSGQAADWQKVLFILLALPSTLFYWTMAYILFQKFGLRALLFLMLSYFLPYLILPLCLFIPIGYFLHLEFMRRKQTASR